MENLMFSFMERVHGKNIIRFFITPVQKTNYAKLTQFHGRFMNSVLLLLSGGYFQVAQGHGASVKSDTQVLDQKRKVSGFKL